MREKPHHFPTISKKWWDDPEAHEKSPGWGRGSKWWGNGGLLLFIPRLGQQIVGQARQHLVGRLLFLGRRVVAQQGFRRHVEGNRRPLGVNILLRRPPQPRPPEIG